MPPLVVLALEGGAALAARAALREIPNLEDQAINYGRLSSEWGPSQINLALTLYRMGEVEEACRALENPPRSIPEVWKRQAESVRNWILHPHAKDAK